MQLLEAINRVMRSAGQEALTDLSDTSMERGNAEEAINRARKQILTNGYLFNTDIIDLQPDPAESNKVPFPQGFLYVGLQERLFKFKKSGNETRLLSFRYTENSKGKQQAFVFDLKTAKFVVAEVTEVEQVFDVFVNSEEGKGFERIPDHCAEWIATRAAADYFMEVNGGPSTLLEARAEKSKTLFINKEPFADIHTVSGFRSLEAAGQGGTSTFDVRTQSR